MKKYNEFYEALLKVPKGKVVSYGQLAMLAGYPVGARLAGRAMSCVPQEMELPCHRVVHSDGRLVVGWEDQKSLLEDEGVVFSSSGRVNMRKYVWRIDISIEEN